MTLPTDEQILITREFDAPKHLVYKAWTAPELVRRWWSGHQGEVTIAEIDLRVGGGWRYVMVADGGFEVAFHGEYREIVPNQRIVTTQVYEVPGARAEEGTPEEGALNIVTFTEVDGRTILTLLVQVTISLRCARLRMADHPDMGSPWSAFASYASTISRSLKIVPDGSYDGSALVLGSSGALPGHGGASGC